jgi:hypothetical protein
MTDRDLMQQALDAFGGLLTFNPSPAEYKQGRDVVAALRERLAQPEKKEEWQYVQQLNAFSYPRPWVGLTKEEAKEISMANRPYVIDMIAALEARLKEKNK